MLPPPRFRSGGSAVTQRTRSGDPSRFGPMGLGILRPFASENHPKQLQHTRHREIGRRSKETRPPYCWLMISERVPWNERTTSVGRPQLLGMPHCSWPLAADAILPNFLVIGAMKAGTTSLHAYLNQHPDVFVSSPKELDFFSAQHNWSRGLD